MAWAVRIRRKFLIWVLPVAILGLGACSHCATRAQSFPPPYDSGLLALSEDYYVVRANPGDTYMGLAWEHNVSPYDVISLNHVKAPFRLRPGELVRIPTPRVHVVRRGDTLSGIAKTYHVGFYDLAQANALFSPYTIYPGQVLVLPSRRPVFENRRREPVFARRSSRTHSRQARTGSSRGRERDYATALPDWFREPPDSVAADDLDAVPPDVGDLDADELDADRLDTDRLDADDRPRPRPKPKSMAEAPSPKPDSMAGLPRPKPESMTESPRTTPDSPAEPPQSTESLMWPVSGPIILEFGPTENGRRNDGINIGVPENTPVRAAADGIVIYRGNEVPGFGNLVLIRHANDLVTAYAHIKEIMVDKGRRVYRGEKIALSGSTGNVDKPQLHFEVRRGVKAEDPMAHLRERPAERRRASLQ